ncbi:MAG: 5-oxoprolinase subunit B family protein [Candidatus Limnocylindria bacterium]
MTRVRPFGEAALLVELDGPEAAQGLRRALLAEPIEGVTGLVPGRASLLVEFDALATDLASLEARLRSRTPAPEVAGRERRIPVVYDGADLAEVAELVGLPEPAVVDAHAAGEHRVLFGGFAPGFAYVGGLPESWQIPRLATPRTRTPAGSVAVADGMTGIYPAELPGGWRVIGRTPVTLFDPRREPPVYLEPGDRVRFEPIGVEDWERHVGPPEDW